MGQKDIHFGKFACVFSCRGPTVKDRVNNDSLCSMVSVAGAAKIRSNGFVPWPK